MNRAERLALIEPVWWRSRCDARGCGAFADVLLPEFEAACNAHTADREIKRRWEPTGGRVAEIHAACTLEIHQTELGRVLRAIERLEITVTPDQPVGYCGIESFTASNGWHFGVFNDCDEWDYLEWAEAPDGRRVTYQELVFIAPSLAAWQPSKSDWGGLTP